MTLFRFTGLAFCLALTVPSGAIGREPSSLDDHSEHVLTLHERVLCPDDGLLLGNGDLSVSVYQTADCIIWRFGKGDVWDRRLDLSDDPKPAHIQEIAHGIEVEGWKCPPYGGPVEATRGTSNPRRMKELCQGTPPGYTKRPFPCPKPVGELVLQLPPDQMGLQIEQRLSIEHATLELNCKWQSGVHLDVACFIAPRPNALVLKWKLSNWNESTQTGLPGAPPLWFSLFRWADPSLEAFGRDFFADFRHGAFQIPSHPNVKPLPLPHVRTEGGQHAIEQTFLPDPLFPNGFKYVIVPLTRNCSVQAVEPGPSGEARLHILPAASAREGCLLVAVPTSRDPGGCEAEWARLRQVVGDRIEATATAWAAENRKSAAMFWARSRVRIAEPLLENLWYETLHARRCAYRHDTVPPGLFLPSTVQDYSHWHGDYHLNYNLQEPFWGDYTANQIELGDAYFQAMTYLLQIGRKIAHDYYDARGVFIQLSGYPVQAPDDYLGVVPMGRMAYMTGWAMNQYWWRYLYTLDTDWLRTTGYPVIRDCALFYTDFLRKGSDGLYHAFPSNQGEDGFSGNVRDFTDRRQVMQHARYCLRAAIRAGEILNTDSELRAAWRDRLDHCAGDDGQPPVRLSGIDRLTAEANPPEFGVGRPYHPQPETYNGPPGSANPTTWYFGQYPWSVLGNLRGGSFSAARDFPSFASCVRRWRHPNGLVWAMAIAGYGHAGAWTESLGVIAPLQEMMLQSWDGALRIFPAWPRHVAARFTSLRAEGAFLVSASWADGHVVDLSIKSERGATCHLYSPWPGGLAVADDQGTAIATTTDEYGRIQFPTRPGVTYRISPAGSQGASLDRQPKRAHG